MKQFKRLFDKNIAEDEGLKTERKALYVPKYQEFNESVYSLRLALLSDIDAILAIEKEVYSGEQPWNRKSFEHEIMRNRNALYLVAMKDEEMVGYVGAWFMNSQSHITNVAVLPAYQSLGIGTWMIQVMMKQALAENCVTMGLEVRMSNERAQELYYRLGFTDRRVRKNYYIQQPEDALEMTCLLEKVEDADGI